MYYFPHWHQKKSPCTQIIRGESSIPAHIQGITMHTWETIWIRNLNCFGLQLWVLKTLKKSSRDMDNDRGSYQRWNVQLPLYLLYQLLRLKMRYIYILLEFLPVLVALTFQLACLVNSFYLQKFITLADDS